MRHSKYTRANTNWTHWDIADSHQVAEFLGLKHFRLKEKIDALGLTYTTSEVRRMRISGGTYTVNVVQMSKRNWMILLMSFPNKFRKQVTNQLESGILIDNIVVESKK